MEESLLDPAISFPQSSRDDTLARYMSVELWETNGDSSHYIATLMRYYQKQSLIAGSELQKIKKATTPAAGGIIDIDSDSRSEFETQLQSELSSHDLESFVEMIDKDYLTAFEDSFDCSEGSTTLITNSKPREYYNIIVKKYPTIFSIFSVVVTT